MSTEWMADGKCREVPPETFFPSDGLGVDPGTEDLRHVPCRVAVPGVRA